MTDEDDYFLPKYDRELLGRTLTRIWPLTERWAMIVTLSRMDRVTKPQGTSRRSKHGTTPDGVNLAALDDWTDLHAKLVSWVQMVCEDRHLEPPADNLLSLAGWLNRHITDLALCEGSGEAPDEIEKAVSACERHIDLPREDPTVDSDDPRVLLAKRQAQTVHVTFMSIEAVCRKMDVDPVITERRMRYVVRRAHVDASGTDPQTRTKFWRLGDIIEADTQIREAA